MAILFSIVACERQESNTIQTFPAEDWVWSLSISGSNQAAVVNHKARDLRLTSDGGKSWKVVPAASFGDPVACAFMLNHNLGWAVSHTGHIFKTESGGENWTKLSEIKDTITANQIHFVNEQDGWLLESLSVWRTQDSGATWRKTFSTTTPGVSGQPSGMFVINTNTVVVSGSNGQVYLTQDGGETWKIKTPVSGNRIDFSDVWFVNEKRGWVTGVQIIVGGESYRPLLLETTDGGNTWKEAAVGINIWPSSVCFVGDEGWLAGVQRIVIDGSVDMPGVLLTTKDGGKHWVPVQLASDSPALTYIRFADKTHGWLVGGDRLFRTEDGGNTWRPVLTLPAFK
jgi:photosystem II stability/assembly factor-like uncharacterized protein